MRRLTVILLACAALTGATLRAADDKKAAAVKEELKKFQGEWRTVSFLTDGKEIDADEFKDSVQVFDGERLLYRVKGETMFEATMKLDPAASPKAFDLTYTTAAARGVTRKGIYKIEGDRLTLCYAPLNGERPREFTAPAKSSRQVTVLRRITDADKARDPEAVAKKLLTQCLRLRADDLVQINGSPSEEALLEALAVQARKQGAHPLVTLATTRLSRRFYDDVPEKFDAQKALFAVKLAEIATAQVSIESVDYETLNAGIPAKRVQAQAAANKPAFETLVKRNVRSLWLGNGLFPTSARAKALGVTHDELADLFWGGIAVDYDQMQKTGARLRERFEAGKEMHLTHPNGTDLRLRIEKRPVFVSDGVISADKEKRGGLACWVFLPAGECYVTPAPGFAEGRVVIESMPFEGKHVKGLTLTFKGGKLTDMKAESGLERLRELYEAATGTGKDGLAQIDLGFNPKVSVKPGSKMFAWMAAGAVAVGVGGNDLFGGENTTPFGFTGQVIGGTLEIDGKAVVKDGRLMP